MFDLISDGSAIAGIVVPEDAPSPERIAATELQRYLRQMSGIEVPITGAPGSGRKILIGSAAPTPTESLGEDGYVIRTAGDALLLTGAHPRSALYAVYHLLEQYLGCGFFEDGDQVPARTTISLPSIDLVERPAYDWRIFGLFSVGGYSGLQWYSAKEWERWFDWVIKRRFNLIELESWANQAGIAALAATRMGIPIPLTEWQAHLLAQHKRVFAYLRERGIRLIYEIDHYFPQGLGAPGASHSCHARQTDEFVARWNAQSDNPIPVFDYKWWGPTWHCMDPRHLDTQRFITACVEVLADELGTDHWYNVNMVSEGDWAGDDTAAANAMTRAMVLSVIDGVKAADPQAVIYVRPPFAYARTFEAQRQVVRDAGLPVIADFWNHVPARTPDYQLNDYYWGLPWATGMIVGCGKHTNPWGDMDCAIHNAQATLRDPKAANCRGFFMASEFNHRQYLVTELFAALSWHPERVERDAFLRHWTARRYGPDAAPAVLAVTRGIAETLLSCENMDMTNRPLYRDWLGGYLPGLTAPSVRRTLSYLPRLREALEMLLLEDARLAGSPLYRFDLVDYGRTYLGALFNYRLAQARLAFRAGQATEFERWAAATEAIMDDLARLCSAHELFRLQTHDDRAARKPPVAPGYDNALTNWLTWTVLLSREMRTLIDYCAEDFAELIAHYYRPRVLLYLDAMRRLLSEGKDISGDMGMPYRISDWATPQGMLPWSPFGPPCEPELKAGDRALADQIIDGDTKSGQFDFYEGPIGSLMQDMLGRYPVPDDLVELLSTPEPGYLALQRQQLDCAPGETIQGFHTPGFVERVDVPRGAGIRLCHGEKDR